MSGNSFVKVFNEAFSNSSFNRSKNMTKAKAKTKRPTDSTLRNVRAANKRIKALEVRVRKLERKK